MKIIIQRVLSAGVLIDGKKVANIGPGALLFVGFGVNDSKEILPLAAKKVIEMRYFEDENKKMNQSILESGGQLLAVSQFTLLASYNKGRRPDFLQAMEPKKAALFFDEFVGMLTNKVSVKTGVFGADMQVELINDGPVTFFLEF